MNHFHGDYGHDHEGGGKPHAHKDDEESGAEDKKETESSDSDATGGTGHESTDDTSGDSDTDDSGDTERESEDSGDVSGHGDGDNTDNGHDDEPADQDEPVTDSPVVTPVEMLGSPVGGRSDRGGTAFRRHRR